MEEKTVTIPAISCAHCAMTIKREIGGLDGVASVAVDIAAKRAAIRWTGPATWESIRSVLEEIGYPPEG